MLCAAGKRSKTGFRPSNSPTRAEAIRSLPLQGIFSTCKTAEACCCFGCWSSCWSRTRIRHNFLSTGFCWPAVTMISAQPFQSTQANGLVSSVVMLPRGFGNGGSLRLGFFIFGLWLGSGVGSVIFGASHCTVCLHQQAWPGAYSPLLSILRPIWTLCNYMHGAGGQGAGV